MEIDDKRYKYIYDPSDNGVEELPVGIRVVVSSAPTSMGDQPPQRYGKQGYRQPDEPLDAYDETKPRKPSFHEHDQLDVFQADNRFTFLFHDAVTKL